MSETAPMDAPTNQLIATILSLAWGGLGIDRFYMGYVLLGILKAITFGGFGIWYFWDVIAISHCWAKAKGGEVMVGCMPEAADKSLAAAIDGAEEDLEDEDLSADF